MKILEEGKSFNDKLSIKELDQVIGGAFCLFKYRPCEVPGNKDGKTAMCGLLICKPDPFL